MKVLIGLKIRKFNCHVDKELMLNQAVILFEVRNLPGLNTFINKIPRTPG